MIKSIVFTNKFVGLYSDAFGKRYGSMTLGDFFDQIKNGNWKEVTDHVRASINDGEKRKRKTMLPCITTSGVFNPSRLDRNLSNGFSYVIVLDLDFKDNRSLDLSYASREAIDVDHTLAVHKSVGGNGYAIYVVVDEWKKNTYDYVRSFYEMMLGVNLDKSTSNLARLRYVSYDPDIIVNDNVDPIEVPDIIVRKIPTRKQTRDTMSKHSDDSVMELVKTVIANGDDPTADYYDWFKLGCAISSEYGEGGRSMFHIVSSNYHGYDYQLVDRKYDSIMNMGSHSAGKGTIIYLLSKYQ